MEVSAQAHYRAGMDRFFMVRAKGDPSTINVHDSEDDFRAAIQLDPAFVDPYFMLGVLLESQGRRTEAIELLRGGIAAAPRSVMFYKYLSATLMRAGQLEEAEAVVRRGISIDPASAALHHTLGLCLWRRGEPDAARDACAETLRLCPGYADVNCLLEVMDLEEQAAAGDTGIDIDYKLGEHYHRLHEPQLVTERLVRVPSSDSRYATAQIILSICWELLRKLEDSLEAVRAAVQSEPVNLASRYLLIAKLKGMVDLEAEMERQWEAYQTDPTLLGPVWALLEWGAKNEIPESLHRLEILAKDLASAGRSRHVIEVERAIKTVKCVLAGPQPGDQTPEAKERRWNELMEELEERISLMEPAAARQCSDRAAKMKQTIGRNSGRMH